MKKKVLKIVVGFFAILIILGIIGTAFSSGDNAKNNSEKNETNVSIPDSEAASQEPSTVSESSESSESSEISDDMPSSVSDVDVTFASSINGDVTGNWRLARVATDKETQDYALDYYKAFFKSDDEIHWIVNFSNNTTTSIKCMGDLLFVDIFDYVKGEELSAKDIGSGTLLSEYQITISTGDMEKIQ